MDTVAAVLAAFTPTQDASHSVKKYDTAIRDHVTAVRSLVANQREVLCANASQVLQSIDPSIDSITFQAILLLLLQASTPPPDIERSTLLDETLRFLLNFNPLQIRYVGSEFRKLLDHVASGKLFTAGVTVEALATAIMRLDPTGSMFTSTHLTMIKFAYSTSWIEPALKVLDCDLTFYPGMAGQKDAKLLCDSSLHPASFISVDTGLTGDLKSSAILEYNHLAAQCYMSRRDWTKAYRALERVITHPSKDKGVTKVMDEAYKRWLLIGLLKDGREPNLPSYTATIAKNTYSMLGTPYKNITTQFPTTNAGQLKADIETNRQVWEEDGTSSLIAEVVAAYPKWQIINLRDIYKQVSISQLRLSTLSAETGEILTDDESATRLVQDMINSGLLQGELQRGNNGDELYLHFHDDNEVITEAKFAQEIAQRYQNIEILGKQYKAANERLSSSKEYVRYAVREQKRADKDPADPGVGFDSLIEEEDLMTGITPTA
ncbi:signalosome complex subunit 3 COP9 [Fusarium beomiforme]|uniref:Signalosome complex subunit 3 COP9 n=1 Tax=Fusarium beomiforme TaxID=44412 RepID=A0A9P5AVN1_9HYPO|nr:signalosome complex subunit 3 COP9 [Fusarium beomiforme]